MNRSASKLSVCVPTYNGATYLAESLTSILNQSYTDFELLVVDDSSIDNTIEVIQSFDDPRVTVHRNPHRLGLVGNWNRCLELAQSPYICLFHQDDVMLAENLAQKISVLEQNPQVGLVYSNTYVIDAEGQVTGSEWLYPTQVEAGRIPGFTFFENLILGANNPISCPGVVARRDCYETVGNFDERLPFTADWEMWARMSLFFDIYYLPIPLIQYRLHQSNETHRFRGVKALEELLRAKQLVLDKYPDQILNHRELKHLMLQRFQQQALNQAIYDYQRMEENDARQALLMAFSAIDADQLTSEDFRNLALEMCFQIGQHLSKQQGWNRDLEKGKRWLETQNRNSKESIEHCKKRVEDQQARIAALQQDKARLDKQLQDLQRTLKILYNDPAVRLSRRISAIKGRLFGDKISQ